MKRSIEAVNKPTKKQNGNLKLSKIEQGKKDICKDLLNMDDLFKEAAHKVKQANEKKRVDEAVAEKKHSIEKAEKKRIRDEFKCNSVKPTRFDADLGMPIYSEDDLRIGQGGNSKDCPFDCNCCF